MQGHFPADSRVLSVSAWELNLTVSAIKRYRSSLKHVFALSGTDLASSRVISRMISSFKKSCPPKEIKPLERNLSQILRSLTYPPYEPMKLSSVKHQTWKSCFLFALASAIRGSELHGLFY